MVWTPAALEKDLDRHYADIAKRGESKRIIFFKSLLATSHIDDARRSVATSRNMGLIRSFERFLARFQIDGNGCALMDFHAAEMYQFLASRAEQYFKTLGSRCLTVASSISKASGRQGHASRRPARKAGTKASGGGDSDGDGEPPRPRSSLDPAVQNKQNHIAVDEIGVSNNSTVSASMDGPLWGAERLAGPVAGTPTHKVPSTKTRLASGRNNRSRTMDIHVQAAADLRIDAPAFPQRFSYQSVAIILDCSPQTVKNKVCLGQFPKPIQTVVGPRFTYEQVQSVVDGTWQPEPKAPPKSQPPAPPHRGRPRLVPSQSQGKGGMA